ncbi:hypothetical protein F4780DRAFT_279546 [Xylariomycetidae sp. FL0641]|nr:hypothetical protein F4780DRAFT_279546 [Xylariomycetidae sp. FL0641]
MPILHIPLKHCHRHLLDKQQSRFWFLLWESFSNVTVHLHRLVHSHIPSPHSRPLAESSSHIIIAAIVPIVPIVNRLSLSSSPPTNCLLLFPLHAVAAHQQYTTYTTTLNPPPSPFPSYTGNGSSVYLERTPRPTSSSVRRYAGSRPAGHDAPPNPLLIPLAQPGPPANARSFSWVARVTWDTCRNLDILRADHISPPPADRLLDQSSCVASCALWGPVIAVVVDPSCFPSKRPVDLVSSRLVPNPIRETNHESIAERDLMLPRHYR